MVNNINKTKMTTYGDSNTCLDLGQAHICGGVNWHCQIFSSHLCPLWLYTFIFHRIMHVYYLDNYVCKHFRNILFLLKIMILLIIEFIPSFQWCSCCWIFNFLCNVLYIIVYPSFLFVLAIVLSVLLRFTDSHYPFEIVKLFLGAR